MALNNNQHYYTASGGGCGFQRRLWLLKEATYESDWLKLNGFSNICLDIKRKSISIEMYIMPFQILKMDYKSYLHNNSVSMVTEM